MDFASPEGNGVLVVIDLDVYGLLPLLKTAYKFTDRCHLHLQYRDSAHVEVRLRVKDRIDSFTVMAGEFMNEILDQRLRSQIAVETEPLRNLILAHALSRTSLINPEMEVVDPWTDPLNIGNPDAARHS